MHLKSLTLRGFKSFASATTLDFEPGINCVVGPNGSGKSNVVDALAWVMGEQGAKNLRGGNMADVIFAGTASRPALGRAEVSLTIDNTDGALPIDYTEVTISRTLFRAGGSEYAINGTPCRLLDIQELLSDTGMGRQMHVIIGQGKLDQVLTATPEDRRAFIEEAAGVLKHRRRKEKALNKLQAMQANVTRIEDLTAELRRQLGPLARQASTARRAQAIQQHVFDARARLLADDIAQAQARLSSHSTDEKDVAKQQADAQHGVVQARAQVTELENQINAASPQLASMTETWQRVSSLTERFSSLRALAAERKRSLEQIAPQAHRGESPESIRERAERARTEEAELTADVQHAHDVLNAVIDDRLEKERQETAIDTELAHMQRTLADQREYAARIAGQIATATSRIEALTEEHQRVSRALAEAQQRADEAGEQVARLEQDVVAHTDGDDTLSVSHEQAVEALAVARAAVDEARERFSAAQRDAVAWQTKAETLKMSLAPADATAWALTEHRTGIRGLVRDEISVEPGWEAGIEAALLGIAQGVVISDVDSAIDALRAARQAQAGHVEFLISHPHDSTTAAAELLADLALPADQARLASALIHGEDDIATTLRYALADTIIAVDLRTARIIMKAGASRVATLAGDVISQWSARGGEVEHHATLAQQARYEDACTQAEVAHGEQEKAQQAIAEATRRAEEAQERVDVVATELNSRDSHMAALGAQLGILRQTVASASGEVARNNERLARIDADIAQRKAEHEELLARQEASGEQPQNDETHIAQLHDQRQQAHQETVAARTKETEARLRLRTSEERLRAVAGRADTLENTARAVAERIAQEERAAVRRAEAAKLAASVYQYADRAMMSAQHIADQVSSERAAYQEAHALRQEDLRAARQKLEQALAEQQKLADHHHQQELVLAELTLTFKQLEERAYSDTGMDAQTLLREYGPDQPIIDIEKSAAERANGEDSVGEDSVGEVDDAEREPVTYPYVRAEQEKRLKRAERDLARLGKINPLALEEHEALSQRYTYLADQLADLRQSRTDLLQIVADIDTRVEEVLAAAYTDVAKAFTEVFGQLFPGGDGKLVLTNPEEILSTGIDIEARPPGKRVKRLSLLSGGERSLTAVAFLVAIFLARPSPFYVMDEVEAALDDVNLTRLLGIFRQLQEHSQLLVITHHKRTMEIADALYGVAMRESGVTTVISQRLADVLS